VRADPANHLFHRSAFMKDVDGVAGIVARDRLALGVGIDVDPRQPVGVVGQPLFVDALLDIVRLPDPDGAVALSVARIDPVIGIGIDVIVVAAKEDLAAFGEVKTVQRAVDTSSGRQAGSANINTHSPTARADIIFIVQTLLGYCGPGCPETSRANWGADAGRAV